MADSVLIIAEAGVNHNGSLDRALDMVDVAADAGADVVKFQTFKADELTTAAAKKAEYQVANTRDAGTQLDMLRALELSDDDNRALVERCHARGIRFMSTAFDADSLALLATLDMPAIKVPSGDVTCGPLLLAAAQLRRPLIVSTGMCDLGDVEAALKVLAFGLIEDGDPAGYADCERAYGSSEGRAALERHVTILHCVSQYPASPEAVNLNAMTTLRRAFGLPVGYSDHTLGTPVSVAAVALGATVIEKHFTIDRTLPGPDHLASLEPDELARMIAEIRIVSVALGSAIKQPAVEELSTRSVARRSVVAARGIAAGETFTLDMLAAKRPGGGISPINLWDMIGRSAGCDYAADDMIAP